MKQGTTLKLKFRLLQDDLKLRKYVLVGLLQSLWDGAAANCPDGAIGRFSNEEIAFDLEYDGDPDALVAALLARGWIDTHPEHRLVIHDWPEHCEDSIHLRLARSTRFFADGTLPKLTRLTQKERSEIEEKYAEAHGERMEAHGERTTKPSQAYTKPSQASDARGSAPESPSPPPSPSKPSEKNLSKNTPYKDIAEKWNAVASPIGLPACQGLTDKRKTAMAQRWADEAWRSQHEKALAMIPASDFLKGKNDKGWKANIDWFLRPDSVTKILEGMYMDSPAHKEPEREMNRWEREAKEELEWLTAMAEKKKDSQK